MSDKSSIEWTDATWNPVRGCDEISPGCDNCYARVFAERFRGVPGHPYERGFDPRLAPDKLTEPVKWRAPRRIFVDSMSDLFHEDFPFDYIASCFGVMAACPQHTFQVLTKRPERAAEFFSAPVGLETREESVAGYASRLADLVWDARGSEEWRYPALHGRSVANRRAWPGWPLPNVHIGTSIANQRDAETNIPYLLQIPAAVRFLSVEPLIGPVNIREYLMSGADPGRCANCGQGHGFSRCPNYGGVAKTRSGAVPCTEFRRQDFAIAWVIVGGESGPGARPCDVAWIRSIVAQCKAVGVPVFVKQLGAKPESDGFADLNGRIARGPRRIVLDDRKGGDWNEWPADLRIRQFPVSPDSTEVTRG
jgi:protein gp37